MVLLENVFHFLFNSRTDEAVPVAVRTVSTWNLILSK